MQIDNVIVKMTFGSHLYGTDGPESDLDFKGVFLPKVGDLLLRKTCKSISNTTGDKDRRNTSKDIDIEFYSLHYFLSLALEGQTVALDMLHAPSTAIIESSHLWDVLVEQRSRFYTKNLKAFIGYARKQAAKYGVKGSRLADVRAVVRWLSKHTTNDRGWKLRDFWTQLPEGEHIHRLKPDKQGLRMYQVCGKSFQETARLDYVQPILENFLLQYGKRAKEAEKNKGVDWKAMSHALRVAYQVEELLSCGTMTLPSPVAPLLIAVKRGKIDFKSVRQELEDTIERVEKLVERSTLPERADAKFVKHFIHYAYGYDENFDRSPWRTYSIF